MSFPSVISLSIITSKENLSRLYIINGSKELRDMVKHVKSVFSLSDIKDFIIGFKRLYIHLDKRFGEWNLSNASWVVAADEVGNGKIVLIDLEKLPNGTYILSLSRSIWVNPKDAGEKQISFEAHFYANSGIVEEFQRVLIVREGIIYDAALKS